MEVRVMNRADELKHLRSCVNDLVSVTALPALWAGREPREIVKTLLEALVGMLRLDFVYARVDELVGVPFESVRFAGRVRPEVTPEEVGRALEGVLACDAPAAVPSPAGEGEVRVAGFSLGLNRGNGHVVAASRRHDFPTDTEALLLRVAANQASLAIDNARLYELAQRERAAAEGARRQVADVLESITDSFTVYDREWRVTYFNREAEKLLPRLGLTREAALGKSLWELLPDLVGTVVYEQYHRAVGEQTPVEFELFYPPLGGWYEVRAYPSKDGLAVYSQDITERKRAEEALRRSEQELADFFENAVVGLHWVGPDGTILRANRAELELLGYAAEEYVGHHIAEFHADRAAIADILRRLQAGEVLREYPARLRRRDGSIRQVLIDSSVLWEGDRFVHTRCFTRDVTERRRAEAEREMLLEREQALRAKAEEASRLKDEFLATVSHELRTPLTAILGWAQMLEMTPLDSETARHAVGVIRRNADQQRQIVEDILEVSRSITGKLKLEPEPVEVGSLVQTALDSVGPSAKAKGIRLVTAFDPVAVVRGDPNRLRQVVWNLLSNAVKFTPAGGEVRVSVERLPACARIEVSDTGQGIAPEFLPYVFDRFRQADGSTTRSHGGLGLGLSIVRHLVELHGGTVRAESAGEGKGATFTVELPLPTEVERAAGAAGVMEGQVEAVPPTSGGDVPLPPLLGLRALLVDDNEDTLEMLSMFLRRAGAEVTAASSADAALGELGRVRPDVIVADIGMPETDGYELIRNVRRLAAAQGGGTPAVALTAYAGEADRERALRAGYQSHLAKPVGPEALIEAIVEVAGRSVRQEL